jgi:hypothetical protein
MCFSLGWIESILIDLVIIVALVMILRLFVPWLLAQLGINSAIIMQVINIVVWAIVLIFIIIIVFALVGCLLGAGGHFSLLPRG